MMEEFINSFNNNIPAYYAFILNDENGLFLSTENIFDKYYVYESTVARFQTEKDAQTKLNELGLNDNIYRIMFVGIV